MSDDVQDKSYISCMASQKEEEKNKESTNEKKNKTCGEKNGADNNLLSVQTTSHDPLYIVIKSEQRLLSQL